MSSSSFSAIASRLLLPALLLLGCRHETVLQAPGAAMPTQGITVTGIGKASGPPTVGRATVGVEIRAATADQAIREVNARAAQVIAALKQAGVADADVRTQNLSLHFEQIEPPRPYVEPAPAPVKGPARPGAPEIAPSPPPPPQPNGFYRATNNVEVTIRALEKSGAVLGAATGAGANQILGIQFEIEDPRALEAQARQKAIEDARTRAEALAALSGRKLGRAVAISEGNASPGPMPMMMRAAEASNVPIERGELTITTSVSVVYAFADDAK